MNRQGPRLRNGVDLQLQSAYHDGNWPVVIRLAEKRAKTQNDQYYEILKICAESQLDDPTAKFAAVDAVLKFVKDGTTVKDVDAIDLLDWTTQHLIHEDNFPETLGPLRVRAVKAAPKDRIGATRCLESCLLHWDLNSAQQIAAILDRSFPQDKEFLFWNIVITHLLSTSSQAPIEKKKLYGTLAQKQIERAAQATEQAENASKDEASKAPARSVQTEEEILLLYDIVETHGNPEDFAKLISSPLFSPVVQFRLGRKELLLRAIAKLTSEADWKTVFTLCKECLSDVDEVGQPTLLASDIVVWQHLITAASHLKETDSKAQETIQELLVKLLGSQHLRPMYRRNLLLARVSLAFTLVSEGAVDLENGCPTSLRLRELMNYVSDQAESAACFNDIKSFLERLDGTGLKFLAHDHLPQLAEAGGEERRTARIRLLVLKTQYFVLTSGKTASRESDHKNRCAVCEGELISTSCRRCISNLTLAGTAFHGSIVNNGKESGIAAEILPELSILLAFCSLTLAFRDTKSTSPPFSSESTRHLLHAVLVLETQLSRTPGHSQLSLLLVQLHLVLGSPYRARDIWDTIGVKRTIIDSLAPIFYDRLSLMAPSLLSTYDQWGSHLMDLLQSHYSVSLKLRMPRRLIDAFEAASYSSIMGIPKYTMNLRASCTRAMSLAESRRVDRFLGHNVGELMSDPRFYETHDDVDLVEVIDYGSFPAWGSSISQPMHMRLRLGPAPSNRRCHLSLLSEAFHDLLNYKPPANYKAAGANSEAEHGFFIETMAQLSSSFPKFLRGPESDFTPTELLYFETICLLSSVCTLIVGSDRQALPEVLGPLMTGLASVLPTQRSQMIVSGVASIQATIALLGSMHNIALFRDTAVAIKLTSQWILNFNEKEKARDRSGKSALPKDTVLQVKGLQSAAETAIKEGQGWIAGLKSDVASREFEPKLKRWILDGESDIASILDTESLPDLIDSWQSNVKGWLQVKWA